MIVDTSALIAILFREPERLAMLQALSRAERRRMGAPNWLEACMVVDRRDNIHASVRIDTILRHLAIEVVPFDSELVHLARSSFSHYGRGSEHRAKLNYGDCMAYALAKSTGEPLLFEGDDFIHTDIVPALA